jgi:O-antigen ligase
MIFNKNFLSIIIFLIPLSYIIGIAVTEFFVLLSIGIFLINNKNKILYLDLKIVFLFLFSFYIFLNSFFQIGGEYSENLRLSSFMHFRFVIFSLSIFYLCEMFELIKKRNFFLFLILYILIILIDSSIQFYFGSNIVGLKANYSRISSFFGEELILGSYLIRVLPMILFFIFYFNLDNKKYRFYLIFFFSLYLFSIYISAGRTSFFLGFFIFLTIFFIIKSLRRIIIYSFFLFLFFAVITQYFNLGKTNPGNRLFVKTFNQVIENKFNKEENIDFKINLEKKDLNFFSKDHEGHIILALNLFNNNKIFGVGPEGFRLFCRTINYNSDVGICSTHPHNLTIQILSELGLVGLGFYITALIFIFFYFFKSLYNRKFNNDFLSFYSISLGLIINLFPLIPSGNFFNNWISIILYYNIGIYLYSFKKCISK